MKYLVPSVALLVVASLSHADILGSWRGAMENRTPGEGSATAPGPVLLLDLLKDGKCRLTFDQSALRKSSGGSNPPDRVFDGTWTRKENKIKFEFKVNGRVTVLSFIPSVEVNSDESKLTAKGEVMRGVVERGGVSSTNVSKEATIVFTRPKKANQ